MKRKVISLVLIQILILLGIVVWQWNQELHEYTIDGSVLTSEIGVKLENGYRIEEADPTVSEKKGAIEFAKATIPFVERGSYNVTIHYDTTGTGNKFEIKTDYPPYFLTTEPVLLSLQHHQMTTTIWMEVGIRNLQVKTLYSGEGSLEIGTIHFVQTRDKIGQDVFRIVCFFLLIDGMIWFRFYLRKHPSNTEEGKQKRWTIAILSGILFLLCLPLTSNSLIYGNMEDLSYHLARIVGMKSALEDGQFPIRIHSALNWGFGYASPIFYPEFFLYPSAILHTIGVPLMQSYKVFVFLMNGMTVLISYWCIKGMFQSRAIGLLGSMLYSLSYYRLINVYLRAAVGESMAMTFFPLIVYGLYRIYTMDTKEKSYRFVWIVPAIGYSGLIQSHIISCEMVGVTTLIVCVLFLRSTLERKRFFALCKTAGMAILLNLWFLVPMFQMMIEKNPELLCMRRDGNWIQPTGLTLNKLFHGFFMENGNGSGHYLGMGAVFTIVFFGFLILTFVWDKKEKNNAYYRLGKWFFGLGILNMICTLTIFPWDLIREFGEVGKMLTKFRITTRYLSLITVFFTFLACCLLALFIKKYPVRKKQFLFASAAVVILFAVQLLDTLQSSIPTKKIYSGANQVTADKENIGWGSEYLPSNLEKIDPKKNWAEQTGVVSYQKSGTNVVIHVSNPSEEVISVQMPLIYYLGYRAETIEGENVLVHGGENGILTVTIPAGYEGVVGIWYNGFWYWNVALGLSIAAAVILLWFLYLCRKINTLPTARRSERRVVREKRIICK